MKKILVVSCELDIPKKLSELGNVFGIPSENFIFLIEDFTATGNIIEDDRHFVVPNFAFHADIAAVVKRICLSHQIAKVISNDEFSVFIAAYIRQTLKIEGMTCHIAQKFRDKQMMKKIASLYGIPTPKEYHREDILRGEASFPLIIKPRSLAGSVGIKVLHSITDLPSLKEQADDHYRDMDDEQYMFEVYNTSDIFHIDCVIIAGHIEFISVGAYDGTPLNYLQGYELGCISVPNEQVIEIWHPFTERLKMAFNLPDGVFHIEAFHRVNESPELLEIAYRPGGAGVVDAILHTYGIDLRLIHLGAQLGLINELTNFEKKNAYAYLVYPKDHRSNHEKRVMSVDTPNLKSLPSLKINMLAKVGDIASGEFYCHKDCLGMFVFSGDRNNVIKDYMHVKSGYKLVLGETNDITFD
ncbi:serine kinase [Pectobacterium brasiliense]|uniref:ATP-grasp domain-containing protein n=1 Tax=Pectobacterium brasiliense TaxID=180957 RepID=UPI00057E1BD2|nr:serine kinase [Pectobacterium brasiliense]KHS67213.1 serine kinase [Pectobacterium brasiliense]KHS87135.1 serine kinase [Pectobacterium brasiliense]